MNPYLQDILHNITTRLVKLEEAQTKKEWVGLTDEDKKQIAMEANYKSEMSAWEYAQRVGNFTEAKLKEKNDR